MRAEPAGGSEGVDPDVDLARPADRRELAAHPIAVPMAVALGGGLGSLLRWALSGATPAGPLTGIPWPTWGINIAGCLAIGILLVLLTEAVAAPHPLVRPFLGTGLLGGFTTMSTYADQVLALSRAGEAVLAVGYLCGTLTAALAAVAVGVLATRALTGVRPLLGARP